MRGGTQRGRTREFVARIAGVFVAPAVAVTVAACARPGLAVAQTFAVTPVISTPATAPSPAARRAVTPPAFPGGRLRSVVPGGGLRSPLVFFGGAAGGLLVHESGHVLTGLALGARPSVGALESGPIPFVAIRHAPVSRRKEFVISSAGFWMQHAGSEWILTARPDLRHERAPGLKGVLAFNLATAAVYSAAAFSRRGPLERDTRGMAISLGRDGVPEPVVGVLVLAPALLDGYRYLNPGAGWAVWASRLTKIAGVVATATAGR
jgi:hypothetical protein